MTTAFFSASEVEDALMQASKANAFQPEMLASLTQVVCFWHVANPSFRAMALQKLAPYIGTRH